MLGQSRFGEVSGIVHKIATFHSFREHKSCSFREAFAGWIAFQYEKLPQTFPDHAAECKRPHFPAHHSYDANQMRRTVSHSACTQNRKPARGPDDVCPATRGEAPRTPERLTPQMHGTQAGFPVHTGGFFS